MTDGQTWVPGDVDLAKPNAARVYDYYLGGGHNVAVDREFAKQVITQAPEVVDVARYNRGFLRRSVTFLAQAGVTQFLDLGSGIPTAGNVHEVAHRVRPDARVVYVDNEWVAVAHSTRLLEGVDNAAVVQADLRDAEAVLHASATTALLDLAEPVAVLMYASLHFIPDADDPAGIVRAYRDAAAPGSYLALSHGVIDHDEERLNDAKDLYQKTTTPLHVRSRQEILGLFDRHEMVEPGLVYTPAWRPDDPDDVPPNPEIAVFCAGVGKLVG